MKVTVRCHSQAKPLYLCRMSSNYHFFCMFFIDKKKKIGNNLWSLQNVVIRKVFSPCRFSSRCPASSHSHIKKSKHTKSFHSIPTLNRVSLAALRPEPQSSSSPPGWCSNSNHQVAPACQKVKPMNLIASVRPAALHFILSLQGADENTRIGQNKQSPAASS